jgi:hypothetical protein
MGRLSKGAVSSISMAFLVMCAEKILRLLRLFLSRFMPGFASGIEPASSSSIQEIFTCLKQANRRSLYNHDFRLPQPLFFCRTQAGSQNIFQETLSELD